MVATLVFVFAIVAVPPIIVMAALALVGALVAATADHAAAGRFRRAA